VIDPNEIDAMCDVLHALEQECENVDFGEATEVRRALGRLITAGQNALSMLESDMVRQVEKHARTVNGVTYVRTPVKSATGDHSLILSAAYKRALQDATREDGTVDWEALGEYVADIVTSLYLSPSSNIKRGGLEFLGLDKSRVTTERIKGYKLGVIGDGE
jgi:hypothetical protein